MIVGLAAILVRAPLLSSPGFPADQVQFATWAAVAHTEGFSAVYRHSQGQRRLCNYPPGYLYVLRAVAFAYESLAGSPLDSEVISDMAAGKATARARLATGILKTPAILCDILTCVLLVFWIAPRAGRRFACAVGLVFAFIPAVIHDSAIWGQVDSIHTLLMLVSLQCAARQRIGWMLAVASAATLVKAQSLVLLPIWALMSVQWIRRQPSRAVLAAAIVAGVATVFLSPMAQCLDGVWQAFAGSSTYYPFTHLNGFSAWFMTNPLAYPHLDDNLALYYAKDTAPLLFGMSSRSVGAFSLAAVWLLVVRVLSHSSSERTGLVSAARLLPVAFFVLSTQMHERYLVPAIAIWAWACEPDWRWWAGWLTLGACASLNMFWAWAGPTDAPWIFLCDNLLHRTWLGLVPGAWCSAALTTLFVALLVGFIGKENGKAAAIAGSGGPITSEGA